VKEEELIEPEMGTLALESWKRKAVARCVEKQGFCSGGGRGGNLPLPLSKEGGKTDVGLLKKRGGRRENQT